MVLVVGGIGVAEDGISATVSLHLATTRAYIRKLLHGEAISRLTFFQTERARREYQIEVRVSADYPPVQVDQRLSWTSRVVTWAISMGAFDPLPCYIILTHDDLDDLDGRAVGSRGVLVPLPTSALAAVPFDMSARTVYNAITCHASTLIQARIGLAAHRHGWGVNTTDNIERKPETWYAIFPLSNSKLCLFNRQAQIYTLLKVQSDLQDLPGRAALRSVCTARWTGPQQQLAVRMHRYGVRYYERDSQQDPCRFYAFTEHIEGLKVQGKKRTSVSSSSGLLGSIKQDNHHPSPVTHIEWQRRMPVRPDTSFHDYDSDDEQELADDATSTIAEEMNQTRLRIIRPLWTTLVSDSSTTEGFGGGSGISDIRYNGSLESMAHAVLR